MAPEWYKEFEENGFVVIRGAIDKDKAVQYQQSAFDWLKSFDNPELDLTNRETWTPENLPWISHINTFNQYGVVHEDFFWNIRLEPGVIEPFATIWGTDKLLVSFDALNITLPRRPGHVERAKWPHVDQSPFRRGLACVQGIVNLSNAGPGDGGLVVYPRSHKVTEQFFDEHTNKEDWTRKDFFTMTPEYVKWFESQGYQEHKVIAEPGDLILWDSRLIHYGSEPKATSETIRTVVYVSYAPAKLATPEVLERKKDAFDRWVATTHWPHDNIQPRPNLAVFPDGSPDTRRFEPRHKPQLTDRLLQLAGVKSY